MYSYNSSHKVVIVLLVVIWAVFHFSQRNEEGLYYENGQIKQTGSTKNSLNEGVWTWFHADGTVQLQGKFSNGNREGVWKKYDEHGVLTSESTYLNNQLHGVYYEFDAVGNTTITKYYEKDVLQK